MYQWDEKSPAASCCYHCTWHLVLRVSPLLLAILVKSFVDFCQRTFLWKSFGLKLQILSFFVCCFSFWYKTDFTAESDTSFPAVSRQWQLRCQWCQTQTQKTPHWWILHHNGFRTNTEICCILSLSEASWFALCTCWASGSWPVTNTRFLNMGWRFWIVMLCTSLKGDHLSAVWEMSCSEDINVVFRQTKSLICLNVLVLCLKRDYCVITSEKF